MFGTAIILALIGAVIYQHQKRAREEAASKPPKPPKDDGIKVILGMTPVHWGEDYDENKEWRGEEGVLETSFGASPASEDGESHTSEFSELSEQPEPAIDPFYEEGVGRPQGVAQPVLSNGRFALAKRDADDPSEAAAEDINPREWLRTHSTRQRNENEANPVDVRLIPLSLRLHLSQVHYCLCVC